MLIFKIMLILIMSVKDLSFLTLISFFINNPTKYSTEFCFTKIIYIKMIAF